MTILTVNGSRHSIEDAERRTLLDVLRDDLDLKGAKLGCGEGECGACTVLVDGRAVCACLLLAETAAGREVTTVEAFSETRLGLEITQSLAEAGAVQCGFCTPGFVMAAAGHLATGSATGLEAALEGNLCRCTGYTKIRQAFDGLHLEALTPASAGAPRDLSLKDALAALARDPELVPIAGGTDLMVRYEHDLASRRFLDLTRIRDEEMTTIRDVGDGLSIGALVTWSDITANPLIVSHSPILVQVASTIGGAQIRNAGTIGGNLVTASPGGDGPPALSVLGATVALAGMGGHRTLAMEEFVLGPGRTAIGRGELVVSVRVPYARPGEVQVFRKVGPRRAQAIAKVSLALVGQPDGDNVRDLRIAFGAVGPVPMRCRRTAELLASEPLTDDLRTGVYPVLQSEISPIDDHRSTKEYRRRTAGRLLMGAIGEALA